MAVKSIFKNKTRAFWTLQVSGWVGFALIRMLNGVTAFGETMDYYKPTAIAMITGFCLSLVLHQVLRRLREKPVPLIIGGTIVASLGLALIFSSIEIWGYNLTYQHLDMSDPLYFFGNAMQEGYVLLSWSALYFGINYYLMMQAEKERALLAEGMAHQAQLKMLRYQLNPHFLFNTLNAISTLVMEKDSKGANKMLRNLSSFLRYTLVNQASQQVSLTKELHALALYLEIEEVRFEDRLKVDFKVDDTAQDAKIPSLILQPIIENAIKYAIAPSIDGGTITIDAHVSDERLFLKVCDDGPGITDKAPKDVEKSSGVGIANTRARLSQLYGTKHSLRIDNLKPKGLQISITIPFETDSVREQGK